MDDVVARLHAALAGRYTIEREVGVGGMATVYLATDVKHERLVALKVLRAELAQALGPERFLREIKIAARLDHPHILALFDSGDADGFLYYVMPFVDGESLRDRMTRDRQLPLGDALRLTAQVGRAAHHDAAPDGAADGGAGAGPRAGTNRSAPMDIPTSARNTLSATWRSCFTSVARYTVAMPPAPTSRSIV